MSTTEAAKISPLPHTVYSSFSRNKRKGAFAHQYYPSIVRTRITLSDGENAILSGYDLINLPFLIIQLSFQRLAILKSPTSILNDRSALTPSSPMWMKIWLSEENLIYNDIDLYQLRSERRKWEIEQKKIKSFIQSTR